MQFWVKAATSPDNTTHPLDLVLPAAESLAAADAIRAVSLNEEESHSVKVSEGTEGNLLMDCDSGEAFAPVAALCGVLEEDEDDEGGEELLWSDPITENPAYGATEEWEIHNFTEDAHPIHVHLVKFEVVGREPFGGGTSLAGSNEPLFPETGYKDTVIAYPGEITRIKAKFDLHGLFVWHCHIVEHEDNEMMRPYHVGPIPSDAPLPK
jgi:hypothetical protein